MSQKVYQYQIHKKFESAVANYQDNTAAIYLGTKFSYKDLEHRVNILAENLKNMGIKRGTKIIIYLPNSIQWLCAWFAIQKIGGISITITPIYTHHDLEYIARDCGAEVIFCADTNFGYVKQVRDITQIKQVIVTRLDDLLPLWKRAFGLFFDVVPKGKYKKDKRTHVFRNLVRSVHSNLEKMESESTYEEEQLCQIMYTGGTTRYPKGVPISEEFFLDSALENVKNSDPVIPAEQNIISANVPLFHILGQTCCLATLFVGGAVILHPKVNLDAIFTDIDRYKATSMVGVPTLYRMILEHDRLDMFSLRSVKYWLCGGDALPINVSTRWRERFGKDVFQGYGSTEACGGVSMCSPVESNPVKSVGKVIKGKEIKLVNPDDLVEIRTGEVGELLIHAPLMKNYYLNKPEESEESFIEIGGKSWYRTHDLMSLDEGGNLFFVDRTVDTIKHKGYRISSSEIEAALQEHPAIVASCAIGIPDEKVGERIKAFVVLKEGVRGVTAYELIKFSRQHLVSYKVPHYIEFRDMLPKSKVGKLLRSELRNQAKTQATI